jgi:hypothetical protein
MPFMDLIKNAIFEEEPQAKQPARPVPGNAPASTPSPTRQSTFAPSPEAATEATGDNQFYARLVKQTDFSAVPDLAKIESFAAPLAGVISDKSLRYKAAMATAQSQGGLTKEAILKGFDSLITVLDSSAASFKKQSDDVGKTEVDARMGQVSDLNAAIEQKQKEIADMQQQVKTKQAQVETARGKLQGAKADFAAAYQRRKAEIQQQRKEFETILQ